MTDAPRDQSAPPTDAPAQPSPGLPFPGSLGEALGASLAGEYVPALRYAVAVAAVAVGAALFAIVFRAMLAATLTHGYGAHDIVAAIRARPSWLRVLLPTLGGLVAALCAKQAARGAASAGVGDVMEAVVLGRGRVSLRQTLWKALGSWAALMTGGSIGREGPLIQFGAGLGGLVADVLRIPPRRARALLCAGTAAGFAAAYNTPLAAILFVVEVVAGIAALEALLPTLVATTIATALTRAFVGGGPIYGERVFSLASNFELIAHALLGVVAGLVGPLFMVLLAAGERAFAKPWLPQPARAAVGGLVVGLIALGWPEVVGNGFEPLNLVLGEALPIATVGALLVAKALATTSSVSSGSPGGVFTPTLFLGAALGALLGHVVAATAAHVPGFAAGPVGGYALVGMAALIGATTHAPLMAAVLVFELSGDYAIVLPLLLATATSTIIARHIRRDSIYTAELRRRGLAWDLTLEGRTLREP